MVLDEFPAVASLSDSSAASPVSDVSPTSEEAGDAVPLVVATPTSLDTSAVDEGTVVEDDELSSSGASGEKQLHSVAEAKKTECDGASGRG